MDTAECDELRVKEKNNHKIRCCCWKLTVWSQALREVKTFKTCFLSELQTASALDCHGLLPLNGSDEAHMRRHNGGGSDSRRPGLTRAFPQLLPQAGTIWVLICANNSRRLPSLRPFHTSCIFCSLAWSYRSQEGLESRCFWAKRCPKCDFFFFK